MPWGLLKLIYKDHKAKNESKIRDNKKFSFPWCIFYGTLKYIHKPKQYKKMTMENFVNFFQICHTIETRWHTKRKIKVTRHVMIIDAKIF